MRVRLTFCGLLMSSQLLAQPSVSVGKLEPFELVWSAPSVCPDETSVRSSLMRLLATGKPTLRRLRAEARLERQGISAFTLTLRTDLDGMLGERVLRGQSCESVTDAAVLTMALMLNPDQDFYRDAPTQTNPRPAMPEGSVSLLPARRFELGAPVKPALRLGLQLSAEVGLAAGVLPQVGPEFGLGVSATLGHATLLLNADYGPSQRSMLAERPNMGGSLWTGSLALIGCWTLRGQVFALGPCLGSAATRHEGEGLGVANPQKGVVYWVSPGAGAHLDARLYGKFSLRLLALGFMPVDRPSVFLEDLGEIHRPAAIEGRVQIGVVVDLR